MNRKSTFLGALVLALLAAAFALPGVQLAGGRSERLANGGFEEGFYASPAGLVGDCWHLFHSAGGANYGFYDDTWAPVVYDGQHSQLIEINTFDAGQNLPDRYAGIYQTVAVIPGASYDLSFHGMLRALEDDSDRANYSYRVEYGVDYSGGSDWTVVGNWVEIPWDTVHPRLSPESMDHYSTTITATGSRLSLYVRLWKKWATGNREVDFNLDAVSLKGAKPTDTVQPQASLTAPDYPVVGRTYTIVVESGKDKTMSSHGITNLKLFDNGNLVGSVSYAAGTLCLEHEFAWTPTEAGLHVLEAVVHDTMGGTTKTSVSVTVGLLGQFVQNGGFEGGFRTTHVGEVGTGWGWLTNGGLAEYGFYDDVWPPVVYEGAHSQLIEINTFCCDTTHPDRHSGIFQRIEGLTPGAAYELGLYGMLRALEGDPDRNNYSYRVEWGYDPSGGTDWAAVDNWVEIPWDTVYPRLSPGSMGSYTASFQAPTSTITLHLRVWKKWATVNRELDVNLDEITLRGFQQP
jgi:hypothetical protein